MHRASLFLLALREVIRARLRPECGSLLPLSDCGGSPPHYSVRQLTRAIVIASRVIPNATCLTQALAAQRLLARYGYESNLRFGVAKTDDGKLKAHAWIERSGQVVLGRFPEGAFTVLA
jgi:hypothetical protein